MGIDCLIGFGGNEGDVPRTYQRVAEGLVERGWSSIRCAQLVSTTPVGGVSGQADYLNGAIRAETVRSAEGALEDLLAIERELGRVRRERWGARNVDLDLLLYGPAKLETRNVVIPHPRMSCRRFVLEPAVKVAADMRHPGSGMTLAELLEALQNRSDIAICWWSDSRRRVELQRQVLAGGGAGWEWRETDRVPNADDLAAAKLLILVDDPADEKATRAAQSRDWAVPQLRLTAASSDATLAAEVLAALAAAEPILH